MGWGVCTVFPGGLALSDLRAEVFGSDRNELVFDCAIGEGTDLSGNLVDELAV